MSEPVNGTNYLLFTLRNVNGVQATISNYGGTLTSLLVPDKAGHLGDIVLGFDRVSDYLSPEFRSSNPYFGALIGRFGNRIAQGRFSLKGQTYELATNNGANSLHGGRVGFDQRIWQAEAGVSPEGEQLLKLSYNSPDGEEGYPGTLRVTVVFTLTNDNALVIDYTATTDQPTPINLTNHSYFNLSLGSSSDVLQHELSLAADRYTVADDSLIPTGELRPVQGTAFDFLTPHTIGERIAQVPGGYDHNWVLNSTGMQAAATVYDPASGRTMEVLTDQPGIQFYSGNFLDGSLTGKGNTAYGKHAGFCLETQHFPDSPNQPSFPNTILQPGEKFHSTTTYKFGVRV
jgi:aldose 1-epimerase